MKFQFLIVSIFCSVAVFAQAGADSSQIFTEVEHEAAFPGGSKAWVQFLLAHIDADVPVRNKAKKGSYIVWIQFIVDTTGQVINIVPLTKNGKGMEEEVMRVIQLSPKWIPAWQNGRKVMAYRKQPFTFVVSKK